MGRPFKAHRDFESSRRSNFHDEDLPAALDHCARSEPSLTVVRRLELGLVPAPLGGPGELSADFLREGRELLIDRLINPGMVHLRVDRRRAIRQRVGVEDALPHEALDCARPRLHVLRLLLSPHERGRKVGELLRDAGHRLGDAHLRLRRAVAGHDHLLAGRKQLAEEEQNWTRLTEGVARVLRLA